MNILKKISIYSLMIIAPVHAAAEESWLSDVTFDCVADDGTIYVAPRRIAGLLPVFEPADAATWNNITYTLSGNGTGRDDMIASLYTVNYWKPERVKFPELQGYRPGQCTLKVAVKNPSDATRVFEKEFKVVVTEDPLYTDEFYDGTIILNEEWFGHTNGSLNYITDDNEIIYQAYSRVNPGYSFGATSQHAAIWGGYLIVVSKQASDGGDPLPGGGRFVIADARTLKRLGSIDALEWDGSAGDGRGVAGATPGKVYVSASNGIYAVDISDPSVPTVCGKIGGSDDDADLYNNQVGDIINAGRYVFAVQQKKGILVIDPLTDKIVKVFADANAQGVTQTGDGRVWYATAADGCARFVDIDPNTLEQGEGRTMPQSVGPVTCSWGAWRPTSFRGNHTDNRILFISGSAGIMGGPSGPYYIYDVDTDPADLQPVFTMGDHKGITDFGEEVALMNYGTATLDVRHNRIIALAGRKGAASGGYRDHWVLFVDAESGDVTHNFKLEPYYWFQSLPVFPDKHDPQLREGFEELLVGIKQHGENGYNVDLREVVNDPDNHDSNIKFSLPEATGRAAESGNVLATLDGTTLNIKPLSAGTTNVLVNAESNGRAATISLPVTVRRTTGIADAATDSRSVRIDGRRVYIDGMEGSAFAVYSTSGTLMTRFTADSDSFVAEFNFESGIYVLSSDGINMKFAVR